MDKNLLSPNEQIKHSFSISKQYIYIQLLWKLFWTALFVFGGAWLLRFIYQGTSLYTTIPQELIMVAQVIINVLGCMAVLWLLVYYLFYIPKSNRYYLTNKRVIAVRGLFSVSTIAVDYSDITDVKVNQKFFDKFLYNMGDLFFNTPGSSEYELILKQIGSPYKIKNMVEEYK